MRLKYSVIFVNLWYDLKADLDRVKEIAFHGIVKSNALSSRRRTSNAEYARSRHEYSWIRCFVRNEKKRTKSIGVTPSKQDIDCTTSVFLVLSLGRSDKADVRTESRNPEWPPPPLSRLLTDTQRERQRENKRERQGAREI